MTQERTTAIAFGLIVAFGVAIATPAGTQDPTEQRPGTNQNDTEKIAEAGLVFQKNCASCHQPPDLKFATDRAWLDQLNRTA